MASAMLFAPYLQFEVALLVGLATSRFALPKLLRHLGRHAEELTKEALNVLCQQTLAPLDGRYA